MFRKKRDKRRFFGSDKSPKRTVGQRVGRLWRLIKWAALLFVVGFIAVNYYAHRMDRIIEEKFDRPRKWDLPSRVLSDAEYLYPGVDVNLRAIVAKLDRLGYRNTGDVISGPGDYSSAKGEIKIYLHDFEYPGESFKGFPVSLSLEGGVITGVKRADTGDEIELVRLEPEEIAAIFNDVMEDRTVVKIEDVPKSLIEAVILIEDERFLKHRGVDPAGIVRAMFVNLSHMRVVQGGSTLTQQLVKNFFLYPKRSFARKINEMLIAYRIEQKHSKKEILEAYLNEIYLGQRGASSVSGVEEASRLYFARGVGQITIGEAALLAGMIRSPSEYNPITKPDKARTRRDFVLKRMLEEDLISKDEYAGAIAEKIVTPKPKIRISTAPYFVDFVKRQIASLYPQEVLQVEGLKIFTTLDIRSQLVAEKALADGLASLEKNFANLLPKDHADPLQGCLISIQPSTGYVRALVGGRDYSASQFDRCSQAMRQPGSTFKPFVYLTALDPSRSRKAFTPSSILEDISFEVEAGGKMWSPANYDKKEHGQVTLSTALEQSLNIATSRLALQAGLDNIVKTAADAGIASNIDAVPSLSLGSFELTPMELASAYTIFPNGGIRAEPLAIINVMTKDGVVLEKKDLVMKRAFDAGPVYITTTIMKGVMDRGTGAGARALGFTGLSAGKTGTTSNYKDAWFVGFTPSILALAWVGYDDNAEMRMSGAKAALPIWADYMKTLHPSTQGDFASPSGVILVKIDPRTGGLSNSSCPDGVAEAFIDGTEPRQTCNEISTGQQNSLDILIPKKSSSKKSKRSRADF